MPKVQTTQARSKSSLALNETAKIHYIWSKLKGAKYFSILDIHSGSHHISIHPDLRPKTTFTCPYGTFQWKRVNFWSANSTKCLSLMFKLFFKYIGEFLVFWMDNLLINSFKKMSKYEFFKNKIEYLGHLVSSQGITPMRQKIKVKTDLPPNKYY